MKVGTFATMYYVWWQIDTFFINSCRRLVEMLKKVNGLFKFIVGMLAEVMFPQARRDIEAGKFSHKSRNVKDKIFYSRITKAKALGRHEEVRKALASRWKVGANDQFYEYSDYRFKEWFMGQHYDLVEHLKCLVEQSGQFIDLVEIGTGDGQVLAHYSDVIPAISCFTGLDINEKVIFDNRNKFFDNEKLEFFSCDAMDYLRNHNLDNTIITTYGGVLEYFSRQDLEYLFAHLAAHKNTAISMVEPICRHHQLDTQGDSKMFGSENSFSHNYPMLLEASGFKIRFRRESRIDGHRFILILAEKA